MKSLLYIGHSYHDKTMSTQFLMDLLKATYLIEYVAISFDDGFDYSEFENLKNKDFDILVVFQMPLDPEEIKKYITFEKAVFFPMYDGSGGAPYEHWLMYADFQIINFSKTLHEKLKRWGFSSFHIQYFPRPMDIINWGDEKKIFFWQRLSHININVVEKLFQNLDIEEIHIHNAPDPMHEFVAPSNQIKNNIIVSTWYDKKEDMMNDLEKASIYIAPREYEGIGMSFLEAMAMGRCIVAVNNPTMNEYIEHNKTGILYDLNNINPLAKMKIKEIQINAYKYVSTGYNEWEKKKHCILDWIEQPVKFKKQIMFKDIKKIFYTKLRNVKKKIFRLLLKNMIL